MPPQITCASALPGKTGKHKNCIFHSNTISALLEFIRSLLDFFSLFDSRLILTLLHVWLPKSCNQCIQLGTIGGMVQEKGSRYRCSSWTALHAQCTSALSSWFPISQGIDGWGGKTKRRLISYFFSDTSAKNCLIRSCMSRLYQVKCGTFLRHSVYCVFVQSNFPLKWALRNCGD